MQKYKVPIKQISNILFAETMRCTRVYRSGQQFDFRPPHEMALELGVRMYAETRDLLD